MLYVGAAVLYDRQRVCLSPSSQKTQQTTIVLAASAIQTRHSRKHQMCDAFRSPIRATVGPKKFSLPVLTRLTPRWLFYHFATSGYSKAETCLNSPRLLARRRLPASRCCQEAAVSQTRRMPSEVDRQASITGAASERAPG